MPGENDNIEHEWVKTLNNNQNGFSSQPASSAAFGGPSFSADVLLNTIRDKMGFLYNLLNNSSGQVMDSEKRDGASKEIEMEEIEEIEMEEIKMEKIETIYSSPNYLSLTLGKSKTSTLALSYFITDINNKNHKYSQEEIKKILQYFYVLDADFSGKEILKEHQEMFTNNKELNEARKLNEEVIKVLDDFSSSSYREGSIEFVIRSMIGKEEGKEEEDVELKDTVISQILKARKYLAQQQNLSFSSLQHQANLQTIQLNPPSQQKISTPRQIDNNNAALESAPNSISPQIQSQVSAPSPAPDTNIEFYTYGEGQKYKKKQKDISKAFELKVYDEKRKAEYTINGEYKDGKLILWSNDIDPDTKATPTVVVTAIMLAAHNYLEQNAKAQNNKQAAAINQPGASEQQKTTSTIDIKITGQDAKKMELLKTAVCAATICGLDLQANSSKEKIPVKFNTDLDDDAKTKFDNKIKELQNASWNPDLFPTSVAASSSNSAPKSLSSLSNVASNSADKNRVLFDNVGFFAQKINPDVAKWNNKEHEKKKDGGSNPSQSQSQNQNP